MGDKKMTKGKEKMMKTKRETEKRQKWKKIKEMEIKWKGNENKKENEGE